MAADPTRALLRDLERQSRHDPHDDRVRVGVAGRANGHCEYCLLKTGGQFQIDHIIPPALWKRYVAGTLAAVPLIAGRGGPDHLDNFAWSCPFCNNQKRQQVRYPSRGRGTRLFDPRNDIWMEHFAFVHDYLFIIGLTPIGEATVQALMLNDSRLQNRLALRHSAIMSGEYPPDWARNLSIKI